MYVLWCLHMTYVLSASAKANKMDTEMVESIDVTDDARSFSWAVDSAIRSETGSIFGESRVRSFDSLVDSAIRSSSATEEDLGSSPVHVFAMAEDRAMRSSSGADLGTFPFHVFATAADMRTIAARLTKAVSNAKRHFAEGLFTRAELIPVTQAELEPATNNFPGLLFTLAELKAATNNFSRDNMIDFYVYRGKLVDGREVAIKKRIATRGDSFGKSEFAIFSRLHHRNLVGLVGFCKNRNERLLVYEYMKNGSLHDHLHDKNNVEKASSVLNSWIMRIKIALDASRGIQYLHSYAVPSIIIHIDIKPSNILLDATWTARVFNFDLSFMNRESDCDDVHTEPLARTVGYICPEYLGVVTTKCDVYGLGVVLLELLTGKTAFFKSEEDGGPPLYVVEFAVRAILAGDLVEILDSRVGPPHEKEAEALEILAYTAICCVKRKGKDRPTMNDIVASLELALALCGSSLYYENFSSALQSHESFHMSMYPLHLEEFYTRRSSISLSCWGIHIPVNREDVLM
ncbi:hypothetical protein JHK87_032063 [Glycine soja]|nr:hypothetical protein JHK87_032063 [Glycine soja]